MRMEHVFGTPRITTTVLIILIIIYSVVPVVWVPFAFKEIKWKILGTFLTYIGLSPFLILFIFILVNISSIQIKINPDYIIYTIKKETTTLQTRETEYFVFDYIYLDNSQAGAQYYQVFELGNGMQKVRFTYKLSSGDLQELKDVHFLKGKFKKSIQFKSYGLTLLKKDCMQLIKLIREYTGLEPSLQPGFFNE
jgi:hypothetical protein